MGKGRKRGRKRDNMGQESVLFPSTNRCVFLRCGKETRITVTMGRKSNKELLGEYCELHGLIVKFWLKKADLVERHAKRQGEGGHTRWIGL